MKRIYRSIRRFKGLIVFCAAALGLLPPGVSAAAAGTDYYAGWAVGAAKDGYGSIFRSIDSGRIWMRQGQGQIADVDMEGVVAVGPYTAWVVGMSDGYATIYHTSDGGNTWERKGSPADVPDVGLLKVHAPDDTNVWAVGVGAILHTADGGAGWTNQIPTGYESVELQGVCALDGDTVWATGGPKDGYPTILKSTDAGLSWTRQSGGDVARPGYNHILGISAVDSEMAWAIGGSKSADGWFVLKTTDGGETWSLQTEGAHDGNNVCAVDASTVWTASDSVICWSTDGGATWGAHHSDEYTMGISAVNSREAWASVYYGWEGSIRHTTDGGGSWTVLTEMNGETLPALQTISFSSDPVPASVVIQSGDFDGDGKAEIAVFRPWNGLWAVRGLGRTYFGKTGDIPVSGDYNGDGRAEVSIFRPASGLWAVKGLTRLYFGGSDDTPVPADYDGDSRCDVAVMGKTNGRWAIRNVTGVYFGISGDRPVPADYEGSGTASIAIFRPASGLWAVRGVTRCYFGASSDIPVPGVFKWYSAGLTTGIINNQYPASAGQKSGPFKNQVAVFRPTTGLWAIRGYTRFYYGSEGNIPLVGDYTGDSLDDTIIFNPSSALWAVRGVTRAYYGTVGDIPVAR